MDEAFAWDRAASRLAEMSSSEYVEAPWRPKSGAWLLEQAKVTEVVPESVLRALWQRYDADHNGVLDESELECLLGDLNEMRREPRVRRRRPLPGIHQLGEVQGHRPDVVLRFLDSRLRGEETVVSGRPRAAEPDRAGTPRGRARVRRAQAREAPRRAPHGRHRPGVFPCAAD